MTVNPENAGMGKKRTKKLKKAHPPNPPQWGNKFNNSPPWRDAALRRGGCLSFIILRIRFSKP